MEGSENETLVWYADEYMWAWVHALFPYLFSGEYDYVFVVGVDTLPNPANMHFPVWAYDTGHDITFMDTHYWTIGLNENSLLFKPTDFSRKFLEEFFEFRKGFHLQGDNGPFMEMILRTLGRENEEDGKPGYLGNCYGDLDLGDKSSAWLSDHDFNLVVLKNRLYANCFFGALDRFAGGYGHRESKHLGFSKTYHADSPTAIYQYVDMPDKLTPWANCFNWLRWKPHNRCHLNCLFLHWNGPKEGMFTAIRGGTCPDPTFDWKTAKYNPDPAQNFFA